MHCALDLRFSVSVRLFPKKSARGIRPVRVNARLAVDAVEGAIFTDRHSWAGSVNSSGSGSSDRRLPWGYCCGEGGARGKTRRGGCGGSRGGGGDHFRSTKRTRTLRGYVSSVDSLIVRIVHAGLSDARSSGGRKRRARALLSLRRAVFFSIGEKERSHVENVKSESKIARRSVDRWLRSNFRSERIL